MNSFSFYVWSCFLDRATIQGGILITEIRYALLYLLPSHWVEIRIHNYFGPITLAYVLARFVHLHSFHDFLFRLVIIHIGHTLKCHFYANVFSGFSVGEIFHQTKRFYAYLVYLFSSCLFLVCSLKWLGFWISWLLTHIGANLW